MLHFQIKFACPLTESVTHSIVIENRSPNQVTYVVQFFGDESNFYLAKSTVNVGSKGGKLQVTFNARKLDKSKGELLKFTLKLNEIC